MAVDYISRWPPVFSFIFFLVLSVLFVATLVAMTAILAVQWRKYRQSELLNALKEEMVCRGMSAEEIERVIQAGQDQGHQLRRSYPMLFARRWCC